MKIRRKFAIGRSIEHVIGETDKFYLLPDPSRSGMAIGFPKADWEPVPEEQWDDVTAECHAVEPCFIKAFEGGIADKNNRVLFQPNDIHGLGKYRLRKICVNESEDSVFHQITTAFIVEKKK